MDLVTVREGLLLSLSTPLASKQTVMTIYTAHSIPMPQKEPDVAIQWKLEAEFLAVSEDRMGATPVKSYKLEKCIGSSKHRICTENMAREMGYPSCVATLFFKGLIDALKVCDTKKRHLPTQERAETFGYGVFPLIAAHGSHTLVESNIVTSQVSDMRHGQV